MQSNVKRNPLVLLVLQTGDYSRKTAQSIEEGGATVYSTESGRTAMRFCRAHKPGVVVIDASLTDMTGFELCDSIRTDGALTEQPAVILLANTRDLQFRLRGFISGAQRCIFKKDDPEDLLEAVSVLSEKMLIQRGHETAGLRHSMNLHCEFI